jgi:hypothetical protein
MSVLLPRVGKLLGISLRAGTQAGAVKLPGLGAAPIWSPFFAGLTQSTPHPVGIEVLSIDWRAVLLPPRLIEPSGIDSVKAEFINKL